MKTTEVDLDKLSAYLRNQVGWVPLEKIRKAIPSKHADGRKIEAMRRLGLLDRDGENTKLTTEGRDYAAGSPEARAQIMRNCLRADALYHATLEWMHFNEKLAPTKTDIANYWHDHHTSETGGAVGDALTDPAVFFMRMVGVSGLGKFIAAGTGRETHLEIDASELEGFATGEPPPPKDPPRSEQGDQTGGGTGSKTPPPPPPPIPPTVSLGNGLNVNVEIHIAADAKPATIEEIFKNMRKYLLEDPGVTPDGE
jgi:hypothetical protein